jgi:hypothetical protein
VRWIVLAVAIVSCSPVSSPPVGSQRTAEDVVREFGLLLQNVPIAASREIASEAIRRHYSGLVDPQLLAAWAASPATAPGRRVSSPWPQRIEVTSSSPDDAETIVRGEIVEMTSTGESGRVPVTIRLRRNDSSWLITAFESRETEDDGPRAVIEAYYRAIAARDYESAFRMWGDGGPPGETLEEFREGFARTASVTVTAREPARIEGAAGSQYAEIPVAIDATTTDGTRQRFEGTYTLRRSMVDGATDAQRRWHIVKAAIRETTSSRAA